MTPARKVNTWVLDSLSIAKLCIDAARPRAQLENTKVEWQTDESYKDDWLFSTAYKIMPWKEPPGTVMVTTNDEEITKRTFTLAANYQDVFYRKLLEGPAPAESYAESLVTMAADATDLYMKTLADAQQLNREIEDYWTAHIVALKAVKTTSALVTSLFGGGVGVAHGWATVGIELVQATKMKDAVLVVSKKAAEEVGEKAAEKAAGKVAADYIAKANVTAKLAAEGAAKMDQISASLLLKKSSRKIAKLNRAFETAHTANVTNLAKTSQSLARAQQARTLIPAGVKVLFAIPDILDIIEEVQGMNDKKNLVPW